MQILLTGATGFLGSAIRRSAVARGHRVTALSRTVGNLPDAEVMRIDSLADAGDISGFDALIHLAWQDVGNYLEPAILTGNLAVQFGFLQSALEQGVRNVVVAGSCLEYGRHGGKLSEDRIPDPCTYYGLSKATLHHMLRLAIETHYPAANLKWLRYFYVYGSGQRRNALLPQLLSAIDQGKSTFDMSPGDQERDFIHIDTAAHNTLVVTESSKISGAVNIGNGRALPVREFAAKVIEKTGSGIRLNPGHYPYTSYEPFSFFADNEKLRSLQGARCDDDIVI